MRSWRIGATCSGCLRGGRENNSNRRLLDSLCRAEQCGELASRTRGHAFPEVLVAGPSGDALSTRDEEQRVSAE